MVLACALALPGIAIASDHGPVFSYATPVNSQGEVSCDASIFGRSGTSGSQVSTGTGCGYGITPHITASIFLPATFGSGSLPESRISPGSEWSARASWRFLHSVTKVGKRIESTAYLGVVVPGPQQDSDVLSGLGRAPGIARSLATGLASRRQHVWVGGGYTRFAEASESRRPDTISWSGVYGYRPAKLRRGYDRLDYRGFAELTGEHTGNVRTSGVVLPDSSTTSVWLGPSVLAISKTVSIRQASRHPFSEMPQTVSKVENASALRSTSATSNSQHTTVPIERTDHEKHPGSSNSRFLQSCRPCGILKGKSYCFWYGLRAVHPCDSRFYERYPGRELRRCGSEHWTRYD